MAQCSFLLKGSAEWTSGTENCLPLFGQQWKSQLAQAGGLGLLHTFELLTAVHGGEDSPTATEEGNNALYFFIAAVQSCEISLYLCTDNEKQGILNSR